MPASLANLFDGLPSGTLDSRSMALAEGQHLDWETASPKEALMAAAMEFSGYGIIGWTAEGTIFSWNAGAETLYGYPAAEALGEFITLIVPAERRTEVSNIL